MSKLAKTSCYEVRVPFSPKHKEAYQRATAQKKFRLACANPAKLRVIRKLVKRHKEDNGSLDVKKRQRGYWRVDCQSASKGLFLGLLCLVGGIIILIIFFVMKVTTTVVTTWPILTFYCADNCRVR